MLFCHLCKLEFDTAEDISLHTCVEIKQEYVDAKLLDNYDVSQNGKVEKILKDSLDSIPSLSPSVKIQKWAGKFYLIPSSKLSRT